MTDCLFCKIARKEIPSNVVYEDDAFLAFLDIRPTTEGHTLVIPKEHYDTLLDTPADVAGRFIGVVQKVASGVKNGVGAPACNIDVNVGKEAGQVIFHTHIHIIPRKAEDGLRLWPGMELPEIRMKEIHAAIKENVEKEA